MDPEESLDGSWGMTLPWLATSASDEANWMVALTHETCPLSATGTCAVSGHALPGHGRGCYCAGRGRYRGF